jgi:OFA family oxalate/formate antiporter-like MFS transporter
LAEFSSKEMVQRPSFWKFFFSVTLLSASGSAVISFARDLALTAGAEASLATTLVGVLSLCNGSGRIISGLISDTLGVRKAMLISNTVGILAPIALLLAVNQGSCGICVVGLCLTGVTYGFLATIISAFISSFYGLKNFASNYSIANLMIFPSSLGATIASILLVKTGGYSAPLALLALFAILAMAANVSIKKP